MYAIQILQQGFLGLEVPLQPSLFLLSRAFGALAALQQEEVATVSRVARLGAVRLDAYRLLRRYRLWSKTLQQGERFSESAVLIGYRGELSARRPYQVGLINPVHNRCPCQQ